MKVMAQPGAGRLSTLRLRAETKKITVINAHAPTEEAEDGVKDEFYADLQALFQATPPLKTTSPS